MEVNVNVNVNSQCLCFLMLIYLFFLIVSFVSCDQTSLFTATTASESTTLQSTTLQSTSTSSNSSRIEYRVFLVKEYINEDDLLPDNEQRKKNTEKKVENNKKTNPPPTISTSTTHIYIIAVIGVTPAAVCALVWWIKRLKRKCSKSNHDTARISSSNKKFNTSNPFSINESEIGQITYKIIERAEKLNASSNTSPNISSNALWYNNNNYKLSSVVKRSRRVYSLEIPRKNLEMLELLGEGNFGQVWKAKAVNLLQTNGWSIVAVKTNKNNISEKDSEDLLKELDIMLQLGSHPNVVRLLGCCTINEPYFLIMEYVSNGKLLTYLRNHRDNRAYYNSNSLTSHYENSDEVKKTLSSISSKDLIFFAYQIAKGMEFISSHGIIHRDLAARNVLINDKKTCKIADFGLSKSIRDKDVDFYEQKTNGEMPIRWMSPESLFSGQFSAKSDVWSFGILLWEIITLGSTPYIGMTVQEVIKGVKEGEIMKKPDHCNNELYEIMKSCWSGDAIQRFSFTQLRITLSKMIEVQCGYVDLDHFPTNLYYNLYSSPGEKV